MGTGENLNEHIHGDRWPAYQVRSEMLDEAVEVIRLLWEGETESFWGAYYTVENARIYTLPEELPPIMVAAGGEQSAELAGTIGEGLICTAPKAELVKTFRDSGGTGRPCFGQLTVCWAESEAEARRTAYEIWPNAGLQGELTQELPTPAHFEQAVGTVREDDVTSRVVCGPDPQKHLDQIQQYVDAGFDHVYIHQVGPDQEGFFRFYQREILPKFK